MIKLIDEKNFIAYKKIRLEALLNFPNSFLSTYQQEFDLTDQEWVNKINNNMIFGYFIDNQIVGIIGLNLETNPKINHTATIFGMYLNPAYQGKNIASELLNHVKKIAKNHRVSQIYLGCNAENIRAVNFYKKSGFKIYATKPNYIKINDKFCDDLMMMVEV
jgi:RimJ/RimL family protein N-acetyltransferase